MSLIQNSKTTQQEIFVQNLPEIIQSDIDFYGRSSSNPTASDPEESIRNYIVQQTMAFKVRFLSRIGMGSKPIESMSKEILKKLLSPDNDTIDRAERKLVEMKDLRMAKSYQSPDGDISLNFFFRSDDEFRHDYINRLIGLKVMKTQPAKKHQGIIIFDWDDTLLCTSFLSEFGLGNLPPVVYERLRPLDEIGSQVLLKAVECGPTFIITNAMEGWVQYSSKCFLPKVYEVIMSRGITVISARTGNEELFPDNCGMWKLNAFMSLRKNFDQDMITNILCVGDAYIEIESAGILARHFHKSILKTIKLKQNPKPEELIKELQLINERYDQIYSGIRNLTITLEKRERSLNDVSQEAMQSQGPQPTI